MREMKDSGVPWIGKIPKGWNLMKGRYCYDILSGFPFASDRFSNSSGYPLIRIRDITSGTIETFFDGDYPVEYVIKSGDLLVGMDGDFNIRLWSSVNALLNQRCCKITEKSQYDKRWLYYVLPFNLELINSLAYSTTVKHLSVPDLKEADIPVPSLLEQLHIADFLDAKCVKIDSILERTRASIEEYKKLRQSVITEAVTKGIRGRRPMKDSGVEWVGEIPKEWFVTRVKDIAQTNSGSTPRSVQNDEESTIIWIRTTDLNDSVVSDSSAHLTITELNSASCPILPQGTCLVAMYGGSGTIGKSGYMNVSATINQALCSLTVKPEWASDKYLFYILRALRHYWMKYSAGTRKDPNISQETVRNMRVPIPSLPEQQEIAAYLDEKCAAIDSLIASKEALITELEAYKKSIIYEYVTGKKEVL